MVQFGPEVDLALRLRRIEDWIARQNANPLGQAFSASQSDGSLGMRVYQDTNTGSTAMVFYQGSTTARDANTDQHPWLAYFGELVSGGKFVDSGVIFYRPDGSESAVIGNRGVSLRDKSGNAIFAPDEDSGVGLGRPFLPLPLPVSNNTANWPSTTSTSLATIAISNVYLQQPKLRWQGSAYAPSGTNGQVQLYLPGNVALGTAVTVTGGGFTSIDETITLPAYTFPENTQIVVQAQVTGGTGSLACQTTGLYGVQS